MTTPSITPAQYGAGGLFLSVALACLAQGVHGADLLAYLLSAALVTVAVIAGDVALRRGRAANASDVLHAKAVDAMAREASSSTTTTPPSS